MRHDTLDTGGPCECGAWHEVEPVRPAPIIAIPNVPVTSVEHRIRNQVLCTNTGMVAVYRGRCKPIQFLHEGDWT